MKTKKLCGLTALLLFGLNALISFGLTLPYSYSNTDIVLYASVLPDVLAVLIELVQIVLYAIGFSVLLYATERNLPTKNMASLLLLFIGAATFRRVCDLLVGAFLFSGIGEDEILSTVLYLVPDLLLILGLFAVIRVSVRRYHRKAAQADSDSVLFARSDTEERRSRFYPFKKIYSKENPVQPCLLCLSVILSAVKVISRVIFDISYGAPSGMDEVLIMVGYYLSDLLIGVIFYVLAILILSALYRKTVFSEN